MTEQEFTKMIENTPTEKFSDTLPVLGVDYIKVEKTEKGYTAKVVFDDGVVAYPTLWCNGANQVYLVIVDWAFEIHEQATDMDNNHGLLFYACGYNGKRQTEVKQQCERRGVTII